METHNAPHTCDAATFETLKVWKLARDLRKVIQKKSKVLPQQEKYRLQDQLLKTSRAVTSYIAAGYGRFDCQANIDATRNARAELYVLLDHLIVMNDERYLTDEALEYFRKEIFIVLKKMNAYIRCLSMKCKQTTRNQENKYAMVELAGV